MKKRSWSITQLKAAVKQSFSFRSVLLKLNLKPAGGNYAQIKKYIKENKLAIGHFRGKAWNRGLIGIGKPRISLEKILRKNCNFQSYKLKKRLFTSGLKKQICEECGWQKRSADGRIPLELDHINGCVTDNRLINLRILCPNCHSLKPTHRGKNIKKIKGQWRNRYTRDT